MARNKNIKSTESHKMSVATLAEFVKEKREEKKLSYRKLATLGGIDYNYISRLEKAKQLGSPESLIGLARGLGLRPGELFDVLADEPPPPPSEPTPAPDNELVKVVIKAVIEYLKNTDNLAELQELIGVMTSPYDKRYDAPQPVVEDIAKDLGKGREKPIKSRSFKRSDKEKPPAPAKPKKEQVHQDNTPDIPD